MPKYSKEEAQLMTKLLAIPGLIEKAANLLKEEEFSPELYRNMDKQEVSKIFLVNSMIYINYS
jgi:hypothetical protein